MRLLLLCFVLPTLAAAGQAPSAEDIARCAAIGANDARLACFDALSRPSPTGGARAASPAPVAPAAPQPPVTAKAPSAPAAPTATPAPSAPGVIFDASDPKNFGLSPAQRHFAEAGPKKESGRIVSMAQNQAGHSTIVLDNGQTWVVLDDDGWLSSGQQVTIKRATLGSFTLLSPSNHTYKVHRAQ